MTNRSIPVLATVALVTSALPVLVVTLARAPVDRPVGREVAPVAATASAAERPAVEVLRSWDARRAEAWSRGDAEALGELYVPGSAAGRRDVRSLTAYAGRGLVVRGMRMQLLSAQVLVDRPGLLRLRVTDRLVGAKAVGRGEEIPLPADRASTRSLTLRLEDGDWRMVSVEG